jgi:hypothetical protein
MEMPMRDRMLAFIGSLVIGAAAFCVASVPIVAQTPKPAAKTKTWTPPRAPDGHPDLQGTYDVATMTPLERPTELGNRLVLTKEEAAALEEYEQQRGVKNDEPIRGERKAPPVGGENTTPKSYLEVLEKFGGGPVGGYNNFWLAGGTQIITVNGEKRSSLIVDPENGRVPPLKPDAQKKNAALLARAARPDASEADAGPSSAFDGPEARPLAERCLLGFGSTSGPPTLPNYFYNNLKQIVQTPTSVMILNEMVHDARIIRIGGEHVPQTIRKWMGDSVGHWEGDTLVVDTTNFTDKTQFHGSSDQLHVVERFTRTDANTLLYRFTVEDPATWDRAFTGEYPWAGTDDLLYEYACHEANYALGDILRGARVKEAEDAAKKSGK